MIWADVPAALLSLLSARDSLHRGPVPASARLPPPSSQQTQTPLWRQMSSQFNFSALRELAHQMEGHGAAQVALAAEGVGWRQAVGCVCVKGGGCRWNGRKSTAEVSILVLPLITRSVSLGPVMSRSRSSSFGQMACFYPPGKLAKDHSCVWLFCSFFCKH